MAYLALYRFFRPTTLDGLVRQEHIVKVLKNQIETDKVGHAYLFCGPRGTGKTSTAKIFARAVNCEHNANGSPCGKCDTCKALLDSSNLDIIEIDAASNNGVNEMRDLREKVQYPPISCKYKVYIIDEVHMLTDSAFNALLKTLEEPPKHVIFILATTEAHKIPATILSRCMRFDFKLIPQKDIENLIKKIFTQIGKEFEEEAVSAIARAGEGSIRDALSVADICASYSKGKLTYADVNAVLGSADFFETSKLCNSILSANPSKALSIAESFLGEGKGVVQLVKDIINYFNSCSISKMCKKGNEILKLPDDMYNEIEKSATLVDEHRFLRVMQIFTSLDTELRYSISPKIIFETAIIKSCMPEKDYDVESLISRITELENIISSGNFSNKVKSVSTQTQKIDEPPVEDCPQWVNEDCNCIGFEELEKQENVKSVVQEKIESISKSKPTVSLKGNVFGEFLKALRNARNPKCERVRMICEDADHYITDGKLVILFDIEGAYNNLLNYKDLIKDVLLSIGVEDFELKLKMNDTKIDEDIEKLKSNLKEFEIEIK